MHYVYLLRSKRTDKFYIGSTANLRARFNQHNSGQTRSTKLGVTWGIVYYEAFPNKSLAENREHSLKKHGRGLVELKKRLGFS